MEMPEEMRTALYGSTSKAEERPDPFSAAVEPIRPIWVAPREGEVVIPYESDDHEEKQYSEVHVHLERNFRGDSATITSEPAAHFDKRETTTQQSEDQSWNEPISIADPLEKTAMSRRETALREYFQRAKEQNADFGPEDYAQIAEEEGDVEQAALLRQIAKTL